MAETSSARPGLNVIVLQAQIYLRRFGLSKCLALALLAASAWQQWANLPLQQKQIEQNQLSLKKMQQAMLAPVDTKPAAPPPLAERKLLRFYDALGEKTFVEQQINTLFAIAEHAGITLKQGEYKLSFDKNGGFYTYQATLPVKGTYTAIRQFCEQSLLQIPFAALDEVAYKREQIANRSLEAKVKFTFYLSDSESVAQATTNAMLQEALANKAAHEYPAPKRDKVADPTKADSEEEP